MFDPEKVKDPSVSLLFTEAGEAAWRLSKDQLQETLAGYAHPEQLPLAEVVTIPISLELFESLWTLKSPRPSLRLALPPSRQMSLQRYRQKHADSTTEPSDSPRVFVTFMKNGRCLWSQSGRSLDAERKEAPHKFASESLRVPLSLEQYRMLSAYLEWACESF